jgi:hypothetical protein
MLDLVLVASFRSANSGAFRPVALLIHIPSSLFITMHPRRDMKDNSHNVK